VPILHESDLHGLHDRTFDTQVRIAPVADLRIAAEIFVADVQAADPRGTAVHHDDLPVIAEVDLETIGAAADAVKRPHLDPSRAHPRDTTPRQVVAPDLVVENVDAHAGACAVEKTLLQRASDPIVAHDVELDQHIVARAFDPGEDRRERRFAVGE